MRIFHVSEESDIKVFEPRPVPSPDAGATGLAVWAVDEEHLANYLLPRDCPRVTFAGSKNTTEADRKKFLSKAKRVVVVESGWIEKIKACKLYLYEFPSEAFECIDAGAGYFISRSSISPGSVTKVSTLIQELEKRNIEIRILPNLWSLRDEVAASTLEFSIIRFRNASPRV